MLLHIDLVNGLSNDESGLRYIATLEGIDIEKSGIRLRVSGIDLLDGTPILDIKPYIPYADAITDAEAHYASASPPAATPVDFSERARQRCDALQAQAYPGLGELIEQVLQQDPRPAYRRGQRDPHGYGFRLYDFDIRFHSEGERLVVDDIVSLGETSAG